MTAPSNPWPPIVSFTGCDGAGKSTVARHAVESLHRLGRKPVLIWSRFNNITSKPLLGLARLTGANRKEVCGGVVHGYHDFAHVPWLRWLFPKLQAIDVNLATRCKLLKAARNGDVIVFERGPWDTLADVMLDVGDANLPDSCWGRWITRSVRRRGPVFWIARDREQILSCRPELEFDGNLDRKIQIYRELSRLPDWQVIDNNRPLPVVLREIDQRLADYVNRLEAKRDLGTPDNRV